MHNVGQLYWLLRVLPHMMTIDGDKVHDTVSIQLGEAENPLQSEAVKRQPFDPPNNKCENRPTN